MIMGLIFSLLGDIWLDLKYVYDKHKDIYLYSGFISFMCGHTFFNVAIAFEYGEYKWQYLVLTAGICVLIAIVVLVLEKIMKQNYGKFRPIVVLYTFFVAFTLVNSAVGMIVNGYTKKFIWLTVGALAFLLSDLVLSAIYFGKDKNTKLNVTVNHLLYYFAQFALAGTILLG